MSQDRRSVLRRLQAKRKQQKLAGVWAEIPPWVFCNSEGKPLDEAKARKRFHSASEGADLSGHCLYDLRHTFATSLLTHGAPITYVAAQLGHAKPTTTLQWYARWLPDSNKSYVDTLDQKLAAAHRRNKTRRKAATERTPVQLLAVSASGGCQNGLSKIDSLNGNAAKSLISLEPPVGFEPTTC